MISMDYLILTAAVALMVIGLLGMVLSRHLFRALLALGLAEAGANLMLVLTGYRQSGVAPIITDQQSLSMVDPVPQALVLTAIVIAVGIQALAVALLIRIYRRYGSLDRAELLERFRLDLAQQAGLQRDKSLEAPLGKQPFPPPEQS